MARHKNKNYGQGFTLIELLVVIAIISLLASIALIAFQSAQAKARNVRRLGDMTQMDTALELYFNTYKGYPSSTNGQPLPLTKDFAITIPHAPTPADGVCDGMVHSSDVTVNNSSIPVDANTYYYIAEGAGYTGAYGVTVYPSYTYYFCLGDVTGGFSAGEHSLTAVGIR